MTKEEFILSDLEKYGSQSSWDWEADYRFAQQFYPEHEELIRKITYGGAPAGIRINAHFHTAANKVKQNRLAVLRMLVKKGFVVSYWNGTGEGGALLFGVNRVKVYEKI